ncbi:MAG: TIGR02281 family clan AA aspartic protease [Paracoccaceae bacterium]
MPKIFVNSLFIIALSAAGSALAGSIVMQGTTLVDRQNTASNSGALALALDGLDRQQPVIVDDTITLPRASDGHFYATLIVNGVDIRFLVDTGANGVVLTKKDAGRAGIALSFLKFDGIAETANGTMGIASITLKTTQLGDIITSGFPAFVADGVMPSSLLGMPYLSQFSQIQMVGDNMVLHP